MAPVHVTRLLSTRQCSRGFNVYYWAIDVSFSCQGIYSHFSLLKFVIKPDSLLLEDNGSKSSGERHNQTGAFLSIQLALVHRTLASNR